MIKSKSCTCKKAPIASLTGNQSTYMSMKKNASFISKENITFTVPPCLLFTPPWLEPPANQQIPHPFHRSFRPFWKQIESTLSLQSHDLHLLFSKIFTKNVVYWLSVSQETTYKKKIDSNDTHGLKH